MGFLGSLTLPLVLLQCGPPAVFWAYMIAPRSLLILVALGSSFFWVGVLIVSAAILQGVLSSSNLGVYALAIFLVVSNEEFSRIGLYLLHRRGLRLLSDAASKRPDVVINPNDESLIAVAAGFGHAATHGLLFSVAWLPLASGKGVLYTSQCHTMSWAPAAAFTMLGFFMLHTGSMVIAFRSLSSGKLYQAGAVALVHMCAALLTLANLSGDHCVAVAVTEFCIGTAVSVAAAVIMRQQVRDAKQYTRVTQAEQSEGTDHRMIE